MRRIIITLIFTGILFPLAQVKAGLPFLEVIKRKEPAKTERPVVLPVLKRYQAEIKIELTELETIFEADDRPLSDNGDDGFGGDEAIPASELYEIWNNMEVNPYRISPDSLLLGDSAYINLKNFSFPLLKHYRVNSEFGPRRYRFHYGIDLKVMRKDTVVSVLDGMVRIAKKMKGYGNFVVVRHYNGMESFYGHLDKILVAPDQQVKSGETIGLGGNTGRSTGPHLHLELRYLGQPINPRDMIDFENLCAKDDYVLLNSNNFNYRYGPKTLREAKAAKARAAKLSGQANKTAVAMSNGSASRIYTVKNGDSLGLIAQRTGISVKQLCALNGITVKTVIKPGKKLQY
jgi:murein DD-endopeptidase MepM/ murein hydrolase activator NlpD